MTFKKFSLITLRVLAFLAGFMFLYLFLIQVPRHIFNSGTVLGGAAGVIFLSLGVFWNYFLSLIKKAKESKTGRIILALIASFVSAGLCIYFVTLGSIIGAQKNEAKEQKTLIVLGCQVRGNVPSLMLKARIDSACEYLNKNPDATAILSGGQGADESISEAECMYENLIKAGIDKNRLILEDKSVNTDENIKNSLKIIEDNSLSKDIAVVTSDFHQKRADMICEKYALDAHAVNAPTPAYLVPVYYTREVGAVVVEHFKK